MGRLVDGRHKARNNLELGGKLLKITTSPFEFYNNWSCRNFRQKPKIVSFSIQENAFLVNLHFFRHLDGHLKTLPDKNPLEIGEAVQMHSYYANFVFFFCLNSPRILYLCLYKTFKDLHSPHLFKRLTFYNFWSLQLYSISGDECFVYIPFIN